MTALSNHMQNPRHRGSPVGEALGWASRIIGVAVAMFLPAVAGRSIDDWAGTHAFGVAGLVIGFAGGLAVLIRVTSRSPDPRSPRGRR